MVLGEKANVVPLAGNHAKGKGTTNSACRSAGPNGQDRPYTAQFQSSGLNFRRCNACRKKRH